MKKLNSMEELFAPFTSAPKNVKYRFAEEYSSTVTRQQALEDLDELIYLMENRYCGREYWERRGVQFEDCYGQIRDYIEARETMYISDLCRKIHGTFQGGIVDNHLSLASPMTGMLRFSKQYTAYFADLLVEQQGESYVVIESGTETVTAGETVSDAGCLYPTLGPKGRRRFLLGCRSYVPVQDIVISLDNKERRIPVHRCRANARTEQDDVCMAWKQVQGVDVLRSNCCDYVGGLTRETDYVAMGQEYRGTEALVLNYLSNEGGYNHITREFIQGLNDYAHCREYSMKLISPVTEKCDCQRKWICLSDGAPYERERGSYKGTVYMLVNSETASAGETAVLYARSLRNLVLIGENTMGCNTFGNVAGYVLKNSHIVCRIPNVINLCENLDECGEGRGFVPDYWVDSHDVEGQVLKWLKGI